MSQVSPREALQNRLVEFLEHHSRTFNAPYGIIPGLHELKRGKVRVITFGVSARVDATLFIWGPTNITLRSNRGEWTFKSEQEVYDHLTETFYLKKDGE